MIVLQTVIGIVIVYNVVYYDKLIDIIITTRSIDVDEQQFVLVVSSRKPCQGRRHL